jgi:pectate lyase
MNRIKLKSFLHTANVALLLSVAIAGTAQDKLLAFPGAEGGGCYVTGGRGGKVYHVTTLEDDAKNPGSLRYAVDQKGPRTIVFDVAGTIELKSDLVVNNGDLTIAGQTAPGDGICLRNYCFHIKTDNVIVRYIRSRLGDDSGAETDAAWARNQKDIIVDHCSFSWSVDETASFYGVENFTMQWCYITESLAASTHVKGAHGYGGLWGGNKASYHHNLLAHHYSRTPRLVGNDEFPEKCLIDMRNNVIYNWGPVLGCYGGGGGSYNFVNNYYKPGPATNEKPAIAGRITQAGVDDTFFEHGVFYLSGNRFDYTSPYLGSKAQQNAKASDEDNYEGLHIVESEYATKDDYIADREFVVRPTTTHTAEIAYEKVLRYGGCCLRRDAIDERVANDVRTGGYSYVSGNKGSNGSTGGLIDAPEDVGGYVEYTATELEMRNKLDSDGDGIPDNWEDMYGLDSADPSDALTTHKSGYSWFEYYLSTLVNSITKQCQSLESGIPVTEDENADADWAITSESVAIKGASALRAYNLSGVSCDYVVGDYMWLGRLDKGAYIIVADMGDGRVLSKRIVKN